MPRDYPCRDAFPHASDILRAIIARKTLETSGLPVDDAHRRCWESIAESHRNRPRGPGR